MYFHFKSDINTLLLALMERVFFEKVGDEFVPVRRPKPYLVRNYLAGFDAQLSAYLPRCSRETFEKFTEGYTGAKRRIYTRAANQLSWYGPRRSDSYIAAFVKIEKVMEQDKRIVSRLIQPRHPRYNVSLGSFIHQLEPLIYGVINRIYGRHGPVVQKGYNVVQIGTNILHSWGRFRHPMAIGLDASRFDQHVGVSLLRWEHSQYLKCFTVDRDYKELCDLLDLQTYTRGFCHVADGDVTYVTKGGRCSGDMNTALGNCLIMCACVWAYCQHEGLTVDQYALVNNGDDCVIITEASNYSKFQRLPAEFCDNLGIVMKVEEPVYKLEHVTFCQMRPVFDGQTIRMVRLFPECTSKDALVLKDIRNPAIFSRYCRTLGLGGLALTSGIPILQSYYNCLIRQGAGELLTDNIFADTGFTRLGHGLLPCSSVITPEARMSFYEAFGVLPVDQEALEGYYDQLTVSPTPEEGCRLAIF